MRRIDLNDLETLKQAANESGLARRLGMEITDLSEGHAAARMTITKDLTNFYGMAHGAALYALADHVSSVVGNSLTRKSVMAQSNAYFFAGPPVGGLVLASGRYIKTGRTLGCIEAEVTEPDGRVLLKFSAQCCFLDREEP